MTTPLALLEWASHQPLAISAGVSESTLRRRFRDRGEIQPREAIRRLHLNEAKRLLRETAMPLKEIAGRVGCGSAIAFHTAFKRENEVAPGAYRKARRTAG